MIADHGGRIIDTARDGILAEFGSVVNAVECAVTIQKTMAERNAGVDPDRRMQFRIGVNLGTSYTTRRASTATASTLLPAWRALRNRAPFASRERSTMKSSEKWRSSAKTSG
jgi:class 3 adenylate cyclase